VLTEKLGDFPQARQVGERALRAGLGDGDLHSRLGYVHYSLGDYEASLAHYTRAVALEPTRANALEGLAWALQASGRTREALAAFERAVQVAPYSPSANVALARAYQRAMRHPEAIAAYERGVQLAMRGGDTNFWDVNTLCGLYQRVGALERAENCLRRLDAMQPGVAMVNRRLAQVRESLRREREPR
jgi:tetratricopeptide (TPR) repeat protein